MFDEYITLGQSLVITVFSMVVVFLSIVGLKKASTPKKDKNSADAKAIQQSQPVVNTVVEDDTELVAVITAAIAAMTGTSASGLVVRNIKRLPDLDSAWSKTGKIQLMR